MKLSRRQLIRILEEEQKDDSARLTSSQKQAAQDVIEKEGGALGRKQFVDTINKADPDVEYSEEEAMKRAMNSIENLHVHKDEDVYTHTPEKLSERKKKKKSFPDLTGDGKVTRADILKGRGVKLDEEEKELDEFVKRLDERKKKKKKKPSDHANYTAGRKNVAALDRAVAAYNKAKKTPGKADDMAAIKRRDRLEKKEKPSGIPSKYNMSEKLNRENLRRMIIEIIESDILERKKRKKKKKKTGGRKISSKVDKSLKKKAKSANAPVGALKAIYKKGMGAFYSSGSRSGQNPHSWAMGRVNSVLRGGKARSVDDAQWKSIQKHRKKKRKK